MDTAWEEIRLESAWEMLQGDKAMMDIIMTRIMVLEDNRAKSRLEESVRERISEKRRALELRRIELEEHALLGKLSG